MRAIIVAAGKGSRISNDIGDIPKSLLKINNKSILETTVDKLLSKNIEVSVCVGYKHNMLREALGEREVKFYYNPFYEVCNNIGSLWFAQEEFSHDEDVIILSADVIFDEAIIDRLMESEDDLTMVTDASRILDGDYFFSLSNDGQIVEYGPNVPVERRNCEYIGISKVKNRVCKNFMERLNTLIQEGNIQSYYEGVFFSFIEDDSIDLKTINVEGLPWREIDFIDDYKKAVQQF